MTGQGKQLCLQSTYIVTSELTSCLVLHCFAASIDVGIKAEMTGDRWLQQNYTK
jgi:hypothetical protein